MHHDDHDHSHAGLAADLDQMAAQRRRALRSLAGMAAAATVPLALFSPMVSAAPKPGGGTRTPAPSPSPTPSPAPSPSAACSTIPSETGGPYPGDGTNSANGKVINALTTAGILRSDIRSSFGGMSGTAAGVPLTVKLKLVNTASVCTTLNGYVVYLWHCDRDGKYSLYSVPLQNYLRGIQVTDSVGTVTFTTIFPACYSGRWPHIHFEVYPSLSVAGNGGNSVKTSQIALPADVCSTVFSTATGYTASQANFKNASLATDNVFSDGYALEMATVTGSVSAGYVAELTVGISA